MDCTGYSIHIEDARHEMGVTLCIGHRGAKGHYPENTLPSFQYAIELGCNWIELDVYAVDDELLVIHDDTLERTTNGTGAVQTASLDYLRSLDAGNGATIPTLREVLDLVDNRCGVNIELKGEKTALPTMALLEAYKWPDEAFLLSSFNHEELALTNPRYRRGALFSKLAPDQWQRAARLGAWSTNFYLNDVTRQLVDEAHDKGFAVLVYTVNKPADIERMLDYGVDGIFSDYPDRVLAQL